MGFLKLFLTSIVLWTLVECQSNTTVQIVGHNYTQFDLFKNTGFQPCPSNEIASPKLLARSTDRSTQQGGGSTNVLVVDQTVKTETDFCHSLNGIPIMIPTVPTQTAFFPWWPTFTVQFISLSLSYIGLWWTYKGIKKRENTGMKLPKLFWVQLAFDTAREIAWFFKTIHGFVDPKRFAWVSVVLWLLPFNYLWLAQQLISGKPETFSRDPPSHTEYFGSKEPATVREQLLHQDAVSEGARTQKKSRLFWVPVAIAILISVQWIMTLASVIYHCLYRIGNNQRTRTYFEVPNAVTNPSSIALGMPPACLDWLKSVNVEDTGLLKLDYDQMTAVIITTLQFGVCTIACVERIRKHFQKRRLNTYKHNISTLKITAAASLASLGIAALFTGFWILGTVVLKGRNANMRYTNDLNTTGGCTFAMVGMNKRWGYWNVEYELAFRIIMSALGAS